MAYVLQPWPLHFLGQLRCRCRLQGPRTQSFVREACRAAGTTSWDFALPPCGVLELLELPRVWVVVDMCDGWCTLATYMRCRRVCICSWFASYLSIKITSKWAPLPSLRELIIHQDNYVTPSLRTSLTLRKMWYPWGPGVIESHCYGLETLVLRVKN